MVWYLGRERSMGTQNPSVQLFIQLCAQQVYLETVVVDRLLINVRNWEGEPEMTLKKKHFSDVKEVKEQNRAQ